MKMAKSLFFLIVLVLSSSFPVLAQKRKLWTEADRDYLIKNLISSRDELITETANLNEKQWNYKEAPNRWSINQVVEHIDIWELLMQHEISISLTAGPKPDFVKYIVADSNFYNFIMQEKPHVATDFTKPFTFSVPLGINTGENNMEWFLKMRNESINYLKFTHDDLRNYVFKYDTASVHQIYILTFGHTNRHIRQIKKIKQSPGFPG
jgi:hypothetical protein